MMSGPNSPNLNPLESGSGAMLLESYNKLQHSKTVPKFNNAR